MAKEIILTVKTYADGKLVSESAKVISDSPGWFRWVWFFGVPLVGIWLITMNGGFR